MLSANDAKAALLRKEPTVAIQDLVRYRNVYLIRVRFASEEEADFDPFFSVDIQTGEVRDFSILTDGNFKEIAALFTNAKKGTS